MCRERIARKAHAASVGIAKISGVLRSSFDRYACGNKSFDQRFAFCGGDFEGEELVGVRGRERFVGGSDFEHEHGTVEGEPDRSEVGAVFCRGFTHGS